MPMPDIVSLYLLSSAITTLYTSLVSTSVLLTACLLRRLKVSAPNFPSLLLKNIFITNFN